jgi:hypothetical protein
MNKYDTLCSKCIRVIKSCNTSKQLRVAHRFTKRVLKRLDRETSISLYKDICRLGVFNKDQRDSLYWHGVVRW